MKTSDLNIVILEPSNPENWLTNGETYSKKVYLGRNDSESNWREITNEEKEAIDEPQTQPPVGVGVPDDPKTNQQGGEDI